MRLAYRIEVLRFTRTCYCAYAKGSTDRGEGEGMLRRLHQLGRPSCEALPLIPISLRFFEEGVTLVFRRKALQVARTLLLDRSSETHKLKIGD